MLARTYRDFGYHQAATRVYVVRPSGWLHIGRLLHRWRDEVGRHLRNLRVENWRDIAQCRNQWRLLVTESKTHLGR